VKSRIGPLDVSAYAGATDGPSVRSIDHAGSPVARSNASTLTGPTATTTSRTTIGAESP